MLNDDNLDHGNFSEVVSLVSKFDPILQGHLEKVIKRVQVFIVLVLSKVVV